MIPREWIEIPDMLSIWGSELAQGQFFFLAIFYSSKNPPAKQEIWAWSLGWEYPLEKEMATPLQYSYLGNPMDTGAWWVKSMGSQRVRHNLATKQQQQYSSKKLTGQPDSRRGRNGSYLSMGNLESARKSEELWPLLQTTCHWRREVRNKKK